MAMGSGLLALALLAAEGPSCPPDESTTFQVRVLTLDGLEWRTSSYSRLQPVARRGSSAIWTADRALAAILTEKARSATTYGKIMALGEASLTRAEPVNYIASMDRYADGPMNQSTAIAFMPRPEQIDERFAIRVSGRKLDQGILTRIALEETHVDVIHGVPQTESLKPSVKSDRTPTEVGREVLNVLLSTNPTPSGPTSITSSVQIPEVTQARVEGEWLIPNDGVLLVSLGVKTAADDQGMAVVRERVAVIEATAGTNFPSAPRTMAEVGPPTSPGPFARLASPALPGRSLPQPVEPDGSLADLPPLPEGLASADLDRIKPDPDQPSPQAPILSAPETDPALTRTGYDAAPPAPKRSNLLAKGGAEERLALLAEAFDALAKGDLSVEYDVRTIDAASRPEERLRAFAMVLEAFTKGLYSLEDDGDSEDPKAPKPASERCDVASTFCPADARSMKPGGLKLAPGRSVQIGVSIDGVDAGRVFDTVADLKEALKTPGRTETTIIPLDGKVSLELKATVVPASTEKAMTADKKAETLAPKR